MPTLLRRFQPLLVVLLFLSACQPTAEVAEPSAERPTVEEDRTAILAQSRRLSEAYVEGDIDALVRVYTDDGVAAPSGTDFIQGRPALDSLWALPEGRTILRHEATPTELVIDGDHAYDWGYYEGDAAQDGERLGTFRGKYVIVWERGTDGIWRIAMDMWNSVPDDSP